MTVSDPIESGGEEWVIFSLAGASFILHQIRKMLGLLLTVVNGNLPPFFISLVTTSPYKFSLPLAAPGYLCLAGNALRFGSFLSSLSFIRNHIGWNVDLFPASVVGPG